MGEAEEHFTNTDFSPYEKQAECRVVEVVGGVEQFFVSSVDWMMI